VSILELINSDKVRLVVNTPSPKSGPVRDAAEIRLAATAMGILCLTAIETAVAAAEALDPDLRERLAEVRSLGEWVPEPGKPRRAISFG
jgi:carbamoyl-phosphate synthase large subunit